MHIAVLGAISAPEHLSHGLRVCFSGEEFLPFCIAVIGKQVKLGETKHMQDQSKDFLIQASFRVVDFVSTEPVCLLVQLSFYGYCL